MKNLFLKKSFCTLALAAVLGLPALAKDEPGDSISSTINNLPTFSATVSPLEAYAFKLYDDMELASLGLEKLTFLHAYNGYQYLLQKGQLSKTNLLTIVDYSQVSTNKRLYVIDVRKKKVLINTYVAHGKNSGTLLANNFDTKLDSYKSEIGFLVTAETYTGAGGYSMRFKSEEAKFNGNIRDRNIVLHGSDHVNENFIRSTGMLGRSLGCPAVPDALAAKIIDQIKGGSCFFIYHPNDQYASKSKILNAQVKISDQLLLSLLPDDDEIAMNEISPADIIKSTDY
jgi:hypothetical protein